MFKIQNFKSDFKDVILLLIFSLVALFTRSFIGISFSNFRIGEWLILTSLFVSFAGSIIYYKKYQFAKYHLYLILSFFVLVFLFSDSSFLNSYVYKSSSYIWSIGFMYIGIYFAANQPRLYFLYPLIMLPFLHYLFSTGNYPNIVIEYFQNFSDKFQYPKASDILIVLISVNLILKNIITKKSYIYLFSFTTALFIPLLAYKSRGAALALVIFLVIEVLINFKYIISYKKILLSSLFIFSLVFSFSSLRIASNYNLIEIEEEVIVSYQDVTGSVTEIITQKETLQTFFSFYIENGRLASNDPTTNWRLDIWQDVYYGLKEESKLLKGYGYLEIIPVMLDPSAPGRLGKDGLNENVHNIFFTVLSRGGFLHLFIYILFFKSLFLKKFTNFNLNTLPLVIPAYVNSFFDIGLDGVQFPFVFFFTLGYIISASKQK
jgi:hypothetical protein